MPSPTACYARNFSSGVLNSTLVSNASSSRIEASKFVLKVKHVFLIVYDTKASIAYVNSAK